MCMCARVFMFLLLFCTSKAAFAVALEADTCAEKEQCVCVRIPQVIRREVRTRAWLDNPALESTRK